MRISDWSSDVCSSDLHERARRRQPFPYHLVARRRPDGEGKQRRDRRLRMDGRRSRPHRAPAGALEGVTMQLYLDCDGVLADFDRGATELRSEEHTSELQSLMRISYAVFCLTKKKKDKLHNK